MLCIFDDKMNVLKSRSRLNSLNVFSEKENFRMQEEDEDSGLEAEEALDYYEEVSENGIIENDNKLKEKVTEFFRLLKGTLIGTNKALMCIYGWGKSDQHNVFLDEYFHRRNSLTLTDSDYKKMFNLHCNDPCQKSDFGYKFKMTDLCTEIQKSCRDIAPIGDMKWINKDEEQLEYLISMLNNMRKCFLNDYSLREYSSYFDFDDLSDKITKAITVAGIRYNIDSIDVERALIEMNGTLEAITVARISDIEKDNFRHHIQIYHLQDKIKILGKTELQHKYKNWLSIYNSTQAHLGKFETNYYPKITINNLLGINVNMTISNQEFTKILHLNSKSKELENNESSSGFTLNILQGTAGCGKSTLLRYMVIEWCKNQSTNANINDIDILIYIDLQKSDVPNFAKLLELYMPETSKHIDHSKIREIFLGITTLFIVDSFTDDYIDNPLFKDLLEITRSTNSSILVSLRSGSVTDIEKIVPNHNNITNMTMKDFTVEEKMCFIKKLCTINDISYDETKKILSFLCNIEDVLEMGLQNPSNIVLIFRSLFRSKDLDISLCSKSIRTKTHLFNIIFENMKGKLTKKNLYDKDIGLDFCLTSLYKSALSCYFRGNLNLSNTEIEALQLVCMNQKIAVNDILLTFLRMDVEVTNPSVFYIKHYHQEFMEFFVAKLIYEQLLVSIDNQERMLKENVDINILNRLKNIKGSHLSIKNMIYSLHQIKDINSFEENILNYRNPLKFLIGIMTINKDKLIEKYAEEIICLLETCGISSCTEWFDVIIESNFNKTLAAGISKKIDLSVWTITERYIEVCIFMIELSKPKKMFNWMLGNKYHPNRIDIVIDKNTLHFSQLTPLISQVSEMGCEVSLCLQHQFRNVDVSSEMELLLLNKGRCKVVCYHGDLRWGGLLSIHDDVRDLRLHVITCEAAQSLKMINQLPKLRSLWLNFCTAVPAGSVPIIEVNGKSELSEIKLLLTDVSDKEDHLIWVKDIVLRLQSNKRPIIRSIKLANSSLTKAGLEHLLYILTKEDVLGEDSVRSVEVMSYCITPEQELLLQTLFISHGNCAFKLMNNEDIWQ